ncbi:hypothetical protein G7Y89_g3031 [Cudoniella acicularis]|uniref:FAD-binding domain-containing protein n=1 Tax=Cudoniella acicularis TaxID=354080 RepID=A0A8H4RTE7_9HELO|nr:hypothetical protein G7Y89_g3031 [Cudoniella acicularis]
MASPPQEAPCFIAGRKIIIAGAGIGGLAFSIALHKQFASLPPSLPPPTIIIYERDTREIGSQREGYSMSIRSDGVSEGMQTLRKLGLLEETLAASVSVNQENLGNFVLWDRDWNEILRARVDKKDLPQPHMRIARGVLRTKLIDAVPKEGVVIKWGIACVGAEKLEGGKVRVQLSDDGETDECDLLIVADGTRSKIRNQLRPDDKLDFAGAVQLIGNAVFEGEEGVPKPITRDWGLNLNNSGNGLFVAPVDDHHAIWAVSYRTTTPREPYTPDQYEALMKEVRERGATYKEPFWTLINHTDSKTVRALNAFDKQPISHDANEMSVVYIGDSNHAISPFAGNGANMAMMDGWDLAEQLCKNETLDGALKAFDALCIPRSKAVVKWERRSIATAHATGWRLFLFAWVLRILNSCAEKAGKKARESRDMEEGTVMTGTITPATATINTPAPAATATETRVEDGEEGGADAPPVYRPEATKEADAQKRKRYRDLIAGVACLKESQEEDNPRADEAHLSWREKNLELDKARKACGNNSADSRKEINRAEKELEKAKQESDELSCARERKRLKLRRLEMEIKALKRQGYA